MRKRFELQLSIGQTPVSEIYVNPKSKNALDQLVVALQKIYCNEEYSNAIFSIMAKHFPSGSHHNGRPGMNLWTIFVLAQVRLCLGISYDMLHHLANNDMLLRQLLGINDSFGEKYVIFEYQNIYDNVSKLNNEMLIAINDIIVEFGHKVVFKKKATEALSVKMDSFVVESNIHFPTDYSLLWDCVRKCLDVIKYFLKKYPSLPGWRKTNSWKYTVKTLIRQMGRISGGGGKNRAERLREITELCLQKIHSLSTKLSDESKILPSCDKADLAMLCLLQDYRRLLAKHIDLVERRILKGETIPHEEKMMSIFETYTEWVKKGKIRPAVEFGKKVSIITDQYDLILFHKVMDGVQDRDIVIEMTDEVLHRYETIYSMSIDRGHWTVANKAFLELKISQVILPKLGKRTAEEQAIESSRIFKRLQNKHSAIESNINELEHRGLNRCPDRQYFRFKTYISLGICAYNLKKIGKKILENSLKSLSIKKAG